jgi:hypothetical protein
MTSQVEIPTLFEPHPNFSDVINRNIIQSEMKGGVHLRDLLPAPYWKFIRRITSTK